MILSHFVFIRGASGRHHRKARGAGRAVFGLLECALTLVVTRGLEFVLFVVSTQGQTLATKEQNGFDNRFQARAIVLHLHQVPTCLQNINRLLGNIPLRKLRSLEQACRVGVRNMLRQETPCIFEVGQGNTHKLPRIRHVTPKQQTREAITTVDLNRIHQPRVVFKPVDHKASELASLLDVWKLERPGGSEYRCSLQQSVAFLV